MLNPMVNTWHEEYQGDFPGQAEGGKVTSAKTMEWSSISRRFVMTHFVPSFAATDSTAAAIDVHTVIEIRGDRLSSVRCTWLGAMAKAYYQNNNENEREKVQRDVRQACEEAWKIRKLFIL